MGNETEETLVQLLVKELICKSCSAQMSPPLIQCFSGHHECSECIEKSEKCSICASPRNSSGNMFLERLGFRTTLKCPFANKGCLFSGKALEVAAHEKVCIFGSKPFLSNGKRNAMESDAFENVGYVKTVEESLSRRGADIGKDSPGEFLEEVFASALECPICLTQILPPIRACHNGHQICTACFYRIDDCPVCRGPKMLQTNTFLNQIIKRLDVRCKNASNGCQITRKGGSIICHELVCGFGFKSCPLKMTVECRWRGLKSDFVDHCVKQHAGMISLKSENSWDLRNFKEEHRPQFNLLYVHGVIFRCGWERHGLSRRFSVNHIRDRKNATTYTFELNIVHPGSDDIFIGFSANVNVN
nr:uncharacterized protein LOC111509187 [Leptinotarsa decemlineata]